MQVYEKLEVELAEWSGMPFVVACSSGTAALHLALEARQFPLFTTRVLVPDYTMVACARAVSLAGLTPLFVDCKHDLTIDVERCRDYLKSNFAALPGAILAVHTYGKRCDMDAIANLAEQYNLYVIEDLAEAHGVEPHPRTDAACWSFYKNKIVAGEEGGAVAFRSKELAERARSLRCLGFTDAHDYTHIPRGHNYRLSNVHAELIRDSLRNFTYNEDKRRRSYSYYCRERPTTTDTDWLVHKPGECQPWVFSLRIPELNRVYMRRAVATLNAAGVAARCGFTPMSLQDEYVSLASFGSHESFRAYNEVLYLPCPPGVSEADAEKAFSVIRTALSS